jgi:multidrug efflux pump subunit AcrA (membrane-fusion protein)
MSETESKTESTTESTTGSTTVLRRARFMVGGLVCVLLIGAVAVLVLRSFKAAALETSTALHAKQYVTTIAPKAGGGGQPLTLPGTLQGIIESTVYARSNGYVVRWLKDIGAPVKKGDLLAEITAPEIDQEYSQAVSARTQSAASAELAKSTAERWRLTACSRIWTNVRVPTIRPRRILRLRTPMWGAYENCRGSTKWWHRSTA